MEYTNLGSTGLKVSRLGFGGIPIQRITQESEYFCSLELNPGDMF